MAGTRRRLGRRRRQALVIAAWIMIIALAGSIIISVILVNLH